MKRMIFIFLAIMLIAATAQAQKKSIDIPSEVTLFKNVKVFNGMENKIHDVDVLVVKNEIPEFARDIPTTGTYEGDTKRVSTIQIFANATGATEMVACTEPRPQVCSQDYRPVCAALQDGSFKTYSNGCSACSDPAVTGYREETCE